MSDLLDLPEIGPVAAANLAAVGIEDAETLREVGAQEAFVRIRTEVDPGACLQMLTGLECAVRGVRASMLPPADKAELREWFRSLDAS
ncbi:MAG: TfoX/Sxy family protein [Micrococcales bacterium]|nr:TfoX/Sxy family protein [Micrococcales bacterium]MCL2666614.1 TfoX/Sxy family protein [Micrococcales bacterium]